VCESHCGKDLQIDQLLGLIGAKLNEGI
jgi:hypothetical protein